MLPFPHRVQKFQATPPPAWHQNYAEIMQGELKHPSTQFGGCPFFGFFLCFFFLVLPRHFTQILGQQVSFSQEAEADCGRPSLTASTTEILSLEEGMRLVHQTQSTFKPSIIIICQIHLKLEAPEEAVFSTALWGHCWLRTWPQFPNTSPSHGIGTGGPLIQGGYVPRAPVDACLCEPAKSTKPYAYYAFSLNGV